MTWKNEIQKKEGIKAGANMTASDLVRLLSRVDPSTPVFVDMLGNKKAVDIRYLDIAFITNNNMAGRIEYTTEEADSNRNATRNADKRDKCIIIVPA